MQSDFTDDVARGSLNKSASQHAVKIPAINVLIFPVGVFYVKLESTVKTEWLN
jgi:hypothetical protein